MVDGKPRKIRHVARPDRHAPESSHDLASRLHIECDRAALEVYS